MKTKWKASQVRAAQKWLADTWPALFTPGRDLKPLTVKVHKEILQHPERPEGIPRRAVVEALNRHTRSFGYLFGLSKHSHRFDLSLQQAEPVAEQHKAWAEKALRRAQKLAQAAKRKNVSRRPFEPSIMRSRTAAKVAPQITYKKQRRRMVLKPIAARAAPASETVAA